MTNTMRIGRPFSFRFLMCAVCDVDLAINKLLCDQLVIEFICQKLLVIELLGFIGLSLIKTNHT